MIGRFIQQSDLERDQLDWGEMAWFSRPSTTQATQLTIIEVTLEPGAGHDFHRHPRQEEVIYVLEGQIEQWLEADSQLLKPGDAVYIDENVVHASFNTGNVPARLLVALGPCDGEGGYIVEEVAGEAPWKGLRPR